MHTTTFASAFACLVTLELGLAGLPAAAQSATLGQIAWLAGCWVSSGAERGTQEQWLPPAGGMMLGMGRTVKDGKTSGHEFMQIRAGAGDNLVFIAKPHNKPEGTFTAKSASSSEIVFENLDHDFPQRVIYRLQADGTLKPRIEGLRNGVERGNDCPMHRASCDALAAS